MVKTNKNQLFKSMLLLLFFLFGILGSPSLLIAPNPVWAQAASKDGGLDVSPFSDLNLRFSNQPLIPPEDLIVQTIPLPDLSVAKPFVAPDPQAVIFEDDRRQRVAVLSKNHSGILSLYLLEGLPLDPKLPALVQCAHSRGCDTDRTPMTGGSGCLAICIKELLEMFALNN